MRIKGGFGWDHRSSDHRNLDGFRRMFWGLPVGKMFWSSEDRVRARFHYAESRQNKPQVNLGGNLLKDVASQEIIQ